MAKASQAARGTDWKTERAAASARFDYNECKYGRGLPLAGYTARRDEAFARFKSAADAYATAIASGKLAQADETIDSYMNWFPAALGASDLTQLTRQQTPRVKPMKTALAALAGDAATRHLTMFAQTLAEQTRTISPELKYRYVRAGIDVVGSEPTAQAARDLVKHYDELLRDEQIGARPDAASTTLGKRPFGSHLGMRSTVATARESGSFGR